MSDFQGIKAVWYTQLGAAADVLQYGEQPLPVPGAGEVLVRVYASGVNPSDTKRRSGWGGLPLSHPLVIPHNDGAGVITAVGEGVVRDRIGERVWVYEAQVGRPFGTAAEYVVVPSALANPLPHKTSFAEGACLGVPAMTSHRAIFADGAVQDQVILVTGGAGAVGNYAIQWAKWGGATVITTVSRSEQAEVAQRAGADHIINYKTENVLARVQAITGRDRGVHRIVDVDFYTNVGLADAVLRTNGAIAYYACSPQQQAAIPLMSFMTRNITLHSILVYNMPALAKAAAIRDIGVALADEALCHNIARRFALTEVVAAHQAQESGQLIGKAVIEMP